MSEIPELTPTLEAGDGDVTVWLVVQASERDGLVYASAHQTEKEARSWLSNDNYSRYSGLVKVRVPRALMRERWQLSK